MRNIAKQIEKGRIVCEDTPSLDLHAYEMRQFYEMFREDEEKHGRSNALFCLINNVYMMGVSVGYRKGIRDSEKLNV